MNELRTNYPTTTKEVTMELNFIKSGDYYIPDIKLKNPNIRLGKWGRMRREYLRLAHPIYIVPHIGEWIVTRVAVINYGLRDFINS